MNNEELKRRAAAPAAQGYAPAPRAPVPPA